MEPPNLKGEKNRVEIHLKRELTQFGHGESNWVSSQGVLISVVGTVTERDEEKTFSQL